MASDKYFQGITCTHSSHLQMISIYSFEITTVYRETYAPNLFLPLLPPLSAGKFNKIGQIQISQIISF